MSVSLVTVRQLQSYIVGLMNRSDHHAGPVKNVLLAVIGGILWRMNPNMRARVHEKEGETRNVIWVWFGEERYLFLYNHEAQTIELHREGRRGDLLYRFTNDTTLDEVMRVFEELPANSLQPLLGAMEPDENEIEEQQRRRDARRSERKKGDRKGAGPMAPR